MQIFQASLTASYTLHSKYIPAASAKFQDGMFLFSLKVFSLLYQLFIIFSSWLPYMFPHLCTAQVSFSHWFFHSTGLRVSYPSVRSWSLILLKTVCDQIGYGLSQRMFYIFFRRIVFTCGWVFFRCWLCSPSISLIICLVVLSLLKGGNKGLQPYLIIKTIIWIIELIFKKKFHKKLLFRSKCTPANKDQKIFTTIINLGSSETHILPPAP